MGVFGLWRLLDAAGKPVPVESLEGKILAIDVSIWIHQILQGYQDERGSPVPNAHLVGLFHRICKLLYFKIKPVFVFDGDVPLLKKNTIISRKKQKSAASSKAQRMKYDLMRNLIKRTAVKEALGKANATEDSGPSRDASSSVANNMFELPAKPSTSKASSDCEDDFDSEEEEEEELTPRKQTKWRGNIHSVDVGSAEFKQLPPDVRYDILTDLKETRKQNSWGRLYEMPEETHEFSGYQMRRLLKRRLVQESLEAVEKEIGGKTLTLDELDKLLTEQGIDTTNSDGARRIASDNVTRVIYINDINAAAKAKLRAEEEFDKLVSVVENMNEYELDDEWDSDVEPVTDERWASKKSFGKTCANPALAYMLEHSGLNEEQIRFAMEQNRRRRKTSDTETRSGEARPGSRGGADEGTPGAANDESGAILNGKVEKEGESAEEERSDSVKSSSKAEGVPEIERSSDSMPGERSFRGADSRSSTDDFVEVREAAGGATKETGGRVPGVPEKPQDEISLPRDSAEKETSLAAVDLDSDSGSDDFVEIRDVEIADALFAGRTAAEKRWEITIKPEDSLGEDLFADVFADDAAEADESIGAACVGEGRSAESLPSSATGIVRPVVEIPEENLGTDQSSPESRGAKIDDSSAPSTSAKDSAREIVAPVVDRKELLSMETQLESERSALARSVGSLERQATDITEQMRMEAQELLRLFGIPYVVAPMEAEAQCAYLETIRLTDGTITDDSDIWLFGGQRVYKNFFNSNKHVLQFRSSDIQRHFNLTRRQLIQLALLVGSDYTAGIAGIGPVTALEILAAFPSDGDDLLRGLAKFHRWVKKDGDFGNARTTLRNKLRNVELDKGFPSEAVAQAYLFPTVDESREGFAWGKPNLVLLGDYAREKFGWTRKKLEDILEPILKRQREAKSQRGIESFFEVKSVPRSIEAGLSKRVQKAVRQLGFGQVPELPEAETETGAKKPSKRRGAKRTAKREEEEEEAVSAEPNSAAGSVAKKGESEEKSVDRQKIVKVRADDKYAPERIPQREKDKANALKSKLRAIEVFRKSKRGPGCTKRTERKARRVTKEAELSESSSSS